MANESSYAGVSSVINAIYETALFTMREQNIMQQLVATFADTSSSTPRIWTQYTGGTFATLAETADLSAQTFVHAAAGTLTPSQFGMQYFLTDQRLASDWRAVARDAGVDIGTRAVQEIDTTLCGTAIFGNLTAGTVGTAGGTLTWANIMRANAYLRTALTPFPYYVVLHPVQWYYLASAGTVPPLVQSNVLMDRIANGFYLGGWGGMEFIVDANVPSGTAAIGAMFNSEAIAFDVRRALRIEQQRDASRGGGGFELNATMIYADGVYKPKFGAQLVGTSA